MHWEAWFCPNMACHQDTWMVKHDSEYAEVWNIARTMDDRPFTVAASSPICPMCGTTLQLAAIDILTTVERSSGAAVSIGQLIPA